MCKTREVTSGELPPEIWHKIFGMIKQKHDLKNISLVSKCFHKVVKDHLGNYLHVEGDIYPQDLARLKHLPIKKLHVTFFHFREDVNQWFEVIGEFTQLTYLHFERVAKDNNHIRRESIFFQFDDFLLSKLVNLVNLKELSVEWLDPGNPAGVAQLVHLPIENLYLQNWSVGSVRIAMAVGRMWRLKKLEFNANHTCFRYLSNLRQLKELKTLNLDLFTLQELLYIAHLPLELLDISGCQSFLHDDLFELMKEMKTLKILSLFRCKYNHQNIKRLQNYIPMLEKNKTKVTSW